MTRESTILKVMQLQQQAVYYTDEAAKVTKEANRLIEGLKEDGAATTTSPRKGKLNKESKMKALANFNKSLYKKTIK